MAKEKRLFYGEMFIGLGAQAPGYQLPQPRHGGDVGSLSQRPNVNILPQAPCNLCQLTSQHRGGARVQGLGCGQDSMGSGLVQPPSPKPSEGKLNVSGCFLP